MLQHFRDELILPHLLRLRGFDPLGMDGPKRAPARRNYDA
jgi:hypothetical protein